MLSAAFLAVLRETKRVCVSLIAAPPALFAKGIFGKYYAGFALRERTNIKQMKSKKALTVFASIVLSGLMLTACGKKDDTANDTSSAASDGSSGQNDNAAGSEGFSGQDGNDGGSEGSSGHNGAETILGDNPGHSADIDGDGFIEDIVTGVDDAVSDIGDGVTDIIDDAENIVSDIGSELTPNHSDSETVTTTDSQ